MSKTTTKKITKPVPVPPVPRDVADYRAQRRRVVEQLGTLFHDPPRTIAHDFDHVFTQVEVLAMAAWAKDNGYEDDEQIGDSGYSLAESLQQLYRFLWRSSLHEVRTVFYADNDEDADEAPREAVAGGAR